MNDAIVWEPIVGRSGRKATAHCAKLKVRQTKCKANDLNEWQKFQNVIVCVQEMLER